MKAPLYNQNGEKKGDVALSKDIFGVEASEGLVHSYLVYQMTNARSVLAHTKTRADVRGGGRKPYRQKGTGRARQGSTRNPHMEGGGVAFGPRNDRNFSLMMPKKMRRKALFTLLSNKAKSDKLAILEKFELDAPKTKLFAALVAKLPVERRVLIVHDREEQMLKQSAKNLGNAKVITSSYLNPSDLLNHDFLLLSKKALENLESTYASK